MIIWLTGIPCSGKTTLALTIEKMIDSEIVRLGNRERKLCRVLDGDVLRDSGFSNDVGFSREDREKHLLRTGFMAKNIALTTPFVICAFVSPYEDVRDRLPIDILVHVDCSPETCAKRDVKGMWAKAKAGEIEGFTGHDAPYEVPVEPDIYLNTETMDVTECATKIIEKMVLIGKEKQALDWTI